MLRYEFCVHALIVLAFVHFWHQLRPSPEGRTGSVAAFAFLSGAGFAVQGWYMWRYARGYWGA